MIEIQRHLTPEQRQALTIWKWCYALKAYGFSKAEGQRLCFMRWLYRQGRLIG